MKKKTRALALQVCAALLALPDDMLLSTCVEWLDFADENVQYLDWTDEYRFALGYRVQSDETEQFYASYADLYAAEPEPASYSFVAPGVDTLRALLSNLSPELFYHRVIAIAGDALKHKAYAEHWGGPPSVVSDGYDFMRSLAIHLREKVYRKPEDGHIWFSQHQRQQPGKRKPMQPATKSIPTFMYKKE